MINPIVNFFRNIDRKGYRPKFGGLEILKFLGPGLLVTVGFIDPGNWASNIASGAGYGYLLLWMVTFSTLILIILQHNVAHLGIATGLCLSEATTKYVNPKYGNVILFSAMLASVSTSLAEVLGGAIALEMLFHIPIPVGAILVVLFVSIMLFTNSYKILERWIISFVSIIGLAFLYELSLVQIEWTTAFRSWGTPSFPDGSMMVVMSVLGAVVMPHNLFLHSEIIQSRQWNLTDESTIRKKLNYEFFDTLVSMGIGWAINSAMILLAAATFHKSGINVTELQQAKGMLEPLLGTYAGLIFAIALLFAGVASTITSGMAAGSIFSGIFGEPYDIKDNHSRLGVAISFVVALLIIFLIANPFKGLIISQMILSIQLPLTIFVQVYLTSSEKVMGKYRNSKRHSIALYVIGIIVTFLNMALLISLFR